MFLTCGIVAILALGLWPKQGFVKVRAKSEGRESHFILLGVHESVREWTPTLPFELPHWELESQWILKFLKENCRGQNSLNWKVPYIIEFFLKRRWLKWAHMIHLDTYNINYGQKKGRESPQVICMQVSCHILLERSWWGLQLCFRFHFN